MDTRFLNISKKELENFKKDAEKYGLTTTASDEDMEKSNKFDQNSFQVKEISQNIPSKKFVFSGLPNCGKSTLTYILHKITGKKILSSDLSVEMAIAKECKNNNLNNKSDFKNFCKNREEYISYDKWKTRIIKNCIDTAIENDCLLELGGQDTCKNQEIINYLKTKDVIIAHLKIDEQEWLKNKKELAEGRSNFRNAFEKENEGKTKKGSYEKFCQNILSDRLPKYAESGDSIVIREDENPLKTLLKALKSINKRATNISYNYYM
jgi:shikimate kinase